MTNQHGFFLPYVLFITALIFIIVTASINIYKNDTHITHRLVEQTKIKTLVQMSSMKFKENLEELDSTDNPITYTFPDGNVEITYLVLNKQEIRIDFLINTEKNLAYQFQNILRLPEEDRSHNK